MGRATAAITTLLLAMCSWSCSSADPEADAGVPGYSFSQGKIAACSGDIAYDSWTIDDAAATLVFVNGRSEYTERYHHLVELFGRPWNIIMFDHHGQGRSDGPRAHADDLDAQHVCDMKKVIDDLAAPGLPLVVMAHSMGALISTRFAELHPGVARAYVMGSPMYGLPTAPLSAEQAKSLAKSNIDQGKATEPYMAPSDEKDSCEENFTTHDCAYYDRWLDEPLTWIGPPTWGWLYAALDGIDRAFADAGQLAEPVLILQAGDERWVLNERQNAFCDAVSSCSLQAYDGKYHELFNELDREAIVAEAVAFLDNALR